MGGQNPDLLNHLSFLMAGIPKRPVCTQDQKGNAQVKGFCHCGTCVQDSCPRSANKDHGSAVPEAKAQGYKTRSPFVHGNHRSKPGTSHQPQGEGSAAGSGTYHDLLYPRFPEVPR